MTGAGRAALLMIGGAWLIPLGDAIAKFANETYGVEAGFMAWSRFALGALLIAPFALHYRVRVRELLRLPVLMRGVMISATVWVILQAATLAPLADVYGAFFIAPAVSFALAVGLLRERPSAARYLMIGLGLMGILLIVRPLGGISAGLGLGLLAGALYGMFLTTSRWLAGRHRGIAMLWAQLIVGGVVMAPFGAVTRVAAFPPGLLACLLASAMTSALANLMIVEAYRRAEATRLAPLIHFQLVAATIYGVLIFSTWPDAMSLTGLVLLTVSGLAALALREARQPKPD